MVAPSNAAHRVTKHNVPSPKEIERIFLLRKQTQALIETIVSVCPPSPDRSTAIRKARESMMNAIGSIVVPQMDVVALSKQQRDWDPDNHGEDKPEEDWPF